MRSRRWLLPAVLALPFVTTALIDVYRTAARHPPGDVALLDADAPLDFEPSDLVVDLRPDSAGLAAESGNPRMRLGPGWGEATAGGRWTDGQLFEVGIELPVGGQSALYIEGRVDRNQDRGSRLTVMINGREAGAVRLSRSMEQRLLTVPGGLFRAGANRLEFRLVDPSNGGVAADRTALIRRLAVAADDSAGFPAPPPKRPVKRGADDGTIVVLREGRLTLPFDVPERGCELRFQYRFREPEPNARCRVVVGRRYQLPGRFDLVREETLDAVDRAAGRIHQVVQDRGEPSALIVYVNAAAARGGFVLRNPRVVRAAPRP